MHPYRIVFLLLSLLLFVHGYRGVVNGRIYVKGTYADRDKNPFWFWFSVASIFLFAFALFVFAFVARIR